MKNYIKKIPFIIAILIAGLFHSKTIFSQNVSVNDNGALPNPHAILDIDISTNDAGILIPRLTTGQRIAMVIASGDEGLTVFDETEHSFYFWNGSQWKGLTIQGANWSITGNSTINSSSNFIGTVNADDFVFRTNNVERAIINSAGKIGVNTVTPDVYMHIYGDDGTTATDDARYSNGTGLLVLGNINERNLVIDQNEILARNNGDTSSLYLQNRGGDIRIHYDKDNINHDDGIVIINNKGNVGIGTINPDNILHINAALPYIRFTDTDGGNSWNAGVYGNSGFQRFQITEFTGGASYRQRLVIKEGGFTGIGTVAPEGLLHIKADAGNDATFLIDADAGSDATDTWILRSDATSNNLDFYNDANNFISITSGGNVGMGVNNPQKVLHIKNTVPYIRFEDTDGGNYWEAGNSSGEYRIYEDTNERFEIETGGNIGIGTDNPDSKLHVLLGGTVMSQYPGTVAAFQKNNATDDWSRISIIGGNAGASVLDFGDADKQDIGMLKYDHTDNYLGYFYNGSEILRVEDYGYMGIGRTNPTEVLDVNGAVRVGNTTNTNAGAIRWDGSSFQGYDGSNWKLLDVQTTTGGGWTDGGTNVYLTTTADNVGIGTNTPNEKLEVNGHIRMTDGNQAAGYTMVSDANGSASWDNVDDGVKTRVIRQINGGASTRVTLWSHPEGVDVEFDPSTERVYVTNNTGDATHYWDIVIEGDAESISGSVGSDQYIKHYRKDGEALYLDLGAVDSGWFRIIASDQNNQKDGFIINVVYYGDDLNGTVQYWDN
ncbi:MAG: hypothetical protein DRI94_03275 [Bacteroidetes bacterium]|nr:MAG: hypothetical protein DRI94_03275 [Bacteroidota bacterium]